MTSYKKIKNRVSNRVTPYLRIISFGYKVKQLKLYGIALINGKYINIMLVTIIDPEVQEV